MEKIVFTDQSRITRLRSIRLKRACGGWRPGGSLRKVGAQGGLAASIEPAVHRREK
ncbi:hypothetical protein [Nevskia sp.]|uniref:hypothetical protein n=1 Tax=Nevskia sp. TaxID=1929292 RepID=UPI0025D36057|nr:hypothetical protein [Nevskia sp.]